MILLTALEPESRVPSDISQISCGRRRRWTAEARNSLQNKGLYQTVLAGTFILTTPETYEIAGTCPTDSRTTEGRTVQTMDDTNKLVNRGHRRRTQFVIRGHYDNQVCSRISLLSSTQGRGRRWNGLLWDMGRSVPGSSRSTPRRLTEVIEHDIWVC